MSHKMDIDCITHRAFGQLVTLKAGDQPLRRFTAQEAEILARALTAVAEGRSQENRIFMSPIASDHDFDAEAQDGGAVVTAPGAGNVFLAKDAMLALAQRLRAAAAQT
jgi:hypothetical protein